VALPGNSEIVLSEAVLVRVIVIEVLDLTGSSTITSNAHEHAELNWRATTPGKLASAMVTAVSINKKSQ